TSSILKSINPTIANVLVTNNEEEQLRQEAIGAKIADYLIKHVNPSQILLTIKEFTDNKRIVIEKTSIAYQQEFRNLGLLINDGLDFEGWVEAYKKLIYWELSLEKLEDESMHEILRTQKAEANNIFFKYIEKNYLNWMKNPEE